MQTEIHQDVKVHCPNCSNKRLFDCGSTAEGIVRIKCPVCRSVVVIDLRNVIAEQEITVLQHIENISTVDE